MSATLDNSRQMPRSNDTIEVVPSSGALGAEVFGFDLAATQSADDIAVIRQLLLEHLVIFFRDQTFSPQQQIQFGRRFGALNIHPIYVPLPGYPEIFPVVKEAADSGNIGGRWHSDVTFLEQPALGSILYAREVPPRGGDTIFANQYLAYETLSDGMRRFLDGLNAVHSDAILSSPEAKRRRNADRASKLDESVAHEETTSVHPVVRTHPETGRRGLFINPAFTVRFEGMTEAESKPILEFLYAHATNESLTCRFKWEKGSVAFWDNRCTMHLAVNDYTGYRREMHRVTIDGDRPA